MFKRQQELIPSVLKDKWRQLSIRCVHRARNSMVSKDISNRFSSMCSQRLVSFLPSLLPAQSIIQPTGVFACVSSVCSLWWSDTNSIYRHKVSPQCECGCETLGLSLVWPGTDSGDRQKAFPPCERERDYLGWSSCWLCTRSKGSDASCLLLIPLYWAPSPPPHHHSDSIWPSVGCSATSVGYARLTHHYQQTLHQL